MTTLAANNSVQHSTNRTNGNNRIAGKSDFSTFARNARTMAEMLLSAPTTGDSLADLPLVANTSSHDTGNSQGNGDQLNSALNSIKKNLDQKSGLFNGFFNDVTHSELRGISNTLTQLTPEQTNNVVASLSDQQLSTWTDEIDSDGKFGTGGLNQKEQMSLFDNLVSDLDSNQFARVRNSISDADTRDELTEAVSRTMSTEQVQTAISDHISSAPASAATTTLQKIDTDLDKYENAQTMALLASDVYEDFSAAAAPNALKPGIVRLDPDQLPPKLGISKDQLIDDDSGFYSAIYQQEGDGADASSSYTIAFRGTEDWTDWKTNIASTFGPTKQFELANELVEQLVEKVGADNVVVTGHSLGGGLANYAAMRNEVHSVGLNPKGTASWEAEKIGDVDTLAETYIQNYRVKGEILTSVQENRIPIIQSAAPGPSIDLPSINPDGTDSSLVNDIKDRISGSGGDQQFARSIRRHGSVNVIRGMGELIERTETKALNEILDSHSK